MDRTAVIVGAGLTDVGKVYGRSARSLAAEAVGLAVEDAGLALGQVDGLLINAGKSGGLDLSPKAEEERPWHSRGRSGRAPNIGAKV